MLFIVSPVQSVVSPAVPPVVHPDFSEIMSSILVDA